MNDYAKLRIALRAIATGMCENGRMATRNDMIDVANLAINETLATAEEDVYMRRAYGAGNAN